jgi:hypothetical protein
METPEIEPKKPVTGDGVQEAVNRALASAPAQPDENALESVKGLAMKDVSGHEFDPSVHATDGTGNPLKTGTGKFRKKPGVGPLYTVPRNKSKVFVSSGTENTTQPVVDVAKFRAAGEAMASNLLMCFKAIGGKEFESFEPDEAVYMKESYGRLFELYKWEYHPAIDCVLATVTPLARRGHENKAGRFNALGTRVKAWIFRSPNQPDKAADPKANQ